MIRTLLITGLDGCGKSTLFSKLTGEKPDHVALITLPHIDEDSLPRDSAIRRQARLLNQMSRQADEKSWSDLKALALFGSMLLYEQLVREMCTPLTRLLICERHPLIDPLIYAKFYAERLTADHLKREKLDYYNTTYSELLVFIVGLLPIKSEGDHALEIFTFIHDTFKSSAVPDEQITQLFKVGLPDKIFFLKAAPEILFDRIASRKVAEPHEKLQVLALLDKTYDVLFESISEIYKTPIEYIDAARFETLDKFYDRLLDELIKSN
jgi:thymidylate kinase